MLLIFFSWILFFIALRGYGYLFKGILTSAPNQSSLDFYDELWLGLFGLMALVCLVNVFLPVNAVVTVIVMVLPYLALGWKRYTSSNQKCTHPFDKWSLVFIAAVSMIALYFSALPTQTLDTFLYHYPAVMWFSEEPVVPGIVNLNLFLGYNSSFHVLSALANHGWWAGKPSNMMAGAFVVLTTSNLFHDMRQKDGSQIQRLFCGLLMIFLALKCFSGQLSGLFPDTALNCITVKIATLFTDKKRRYRYDFILLLGALAISMKMSGAAVAAATCVIYLLNKKFNPMKLLNQAAGAWAVFMVTTVVRNVIATGYIFFPFFLPGFPVPWRLPYDQAMHTFSGLSVTSSSLEAKADGFWQFTMKHMLPFVSGHDSSLFINTEDFFWPTLTDNITLAFSLVLLLVWLGILLGSKSFRQNYLSYFLLLCVSLPLTMIWFFRLQLFLRYFESHLWILIAVAFLPSAVWIQKKYNSQFMALIPLVILAFFNCRNLADHFALDRYYTYHPRSLINLAPINQCGQKAILPYRHGYLNEVYLGTYKKCGACGSSPLPCMELTNFAVPLRDPDNFRRGFLARNYW